MLKIPYAHTQVVIKLLSMIMPRLLIAPILISLFAAVANAAATPPPLPAEHVTIGGFHTRALWTSAGPHAPTLLMLPGSGASGPEESSPLARAKVFDQIRAPYEKAGFNVLSLGKPGVEYFSGFETSSRAFYDLALYQNLKWRDLLTNADAALEFLRKQKSVDPQRIYILGHSEGTQLAIDLARAQEAQGQRVVGLILLGFAGEDLQTTIHWQLFERIFDHFVLTDVDANHDGFVTREEAARWPQNFSWHFDASGKVPVEIVHKYQLEHPEPEAARNFEAFRSYPLYGDGIFNRGPIYAEAVSLRAPLFVFTGALDLLTRPAEALKLKASCVVANKQNCFVQIVPDVGHVFSRPRAPRAHPLLDMTLGPVDSSFLKLQADFAGSLTSASPSRSLRQR
jgi:pimeloyl-ACP methyl ester carboxylesterase